MGEQRRDGSRPSTARLFTRVSLSRDTAGVQGAPELKPGERVGKYILKQKLGAGAMGVVFAAEHEGLGREVAIKVLRADFADNANVVERFQREAEVVSRIGHTNIVSVYDFGRLSDGSLYYVMERINGETLNERMRRAPPVGADETVQIMSQICRALQVTHAKGVVHRDLKPDNVMLITQPGRAPHVKVVDYGVAKIREAAEAKGQTAAGSMLGTPAFMAPEQVRGELGVDSRVDIYALGAMLYAILTGHMVFEGSVIEVLTAQVRDPVVPPSRRTTRNIPPAVEAVVMKALSKNPADRYPDATSFAADLEAAFAPERAANAAEARTMAAGTSPLAGSHGIADTMAAGSAATIIPGASQSAAATVAQHAAAAKTGSGAPAKSGGAGKWIAVAAVVVVGGGGAAALLLRPKAGPAPAPGVAPAAAKPVERTPTQIEAERVLATALGGDAFARRAALDAMAAVGDHGAVDQIVTALGDDNPEVRRSAANAACTCAGPGDVALKTALAEAAARSGGAIAVDLAAARFKVGDATAEEDLRRALELRDPVGRLRAAVALADAGKIAAPVMRAAVDAAPPTVRRALLQTASARLVKLGDAGWIEELKKRLAGTDQAARLDAAQALARSGDDAATRALVELASGATDPADGVEAAAVLAELGEAHGRRALETALASPSAPARARAATALGRFPASGVRSGDLPTLLSPLLKDADPLARVAAAAALLSAKSEADSARKP